MSARTAAESSGRNLRIARETGRPLSLDDLATPFLYVDLERMNTNIDTMAAAARDLGVRLRPHAKTHKVPEIARLQVAAGAAGITGSKVSEAGVLADAGLDGLFLAHEIVGGPPPQPRRPPPP